MDARYVTTWPNGISVQANISIRYLANMLGPSYSCEWKNVSNLAQLSTRMQRTNPRS